MTHAAYALITLAILAATAVPLLQRHAASRRRLRQLLAQRQEDIHAIFAPDDGPEAFKGRYVFAVFQLVCKGAARPPAKPDQQAAEADERRLDFFLITGEESRKELTKTLQHAREAADAVDEQEYRMAVRQLQTAAADLLRIIRELEERVPDGPVDPAGIEHAKTIWKGGFPGLYERLISKWYAENRDRTRVASATASEPTRVISAPAQDGTIVLGPAVKPSDATLILGAAREGDDSIIEPAEPSGTEMTDTFARALQETDQEDVC